jgi:copper homeostasis protein
MTRTFIIENCANSAHSALLAQAGGADRVELCASMPEGGTTPSIGEIRVARKLLTHTKLHILIRPRGADFCYSTTEVDCMLADIQAAREAGADGVVMGALLPNGDIDVATMHRLIEAASGMAVTFHRAFDVCRDPLAALEQIIALGCSRLLTSGQCATALEGASLIARLISAAHGRIVVMPGCGITPTNIAQLARLTGATEFHLSARSEVPSQMTFRRPEVSMGGTVHIDEYTLQRTDASKLRAARQALQEL